MRPIPEKMLARTRDEADRALEVAKKSVGGMTDEVYDDLSLIIQEGVRDTLTQLTEVLGQCVDTFDPLMEIIDDLPRPDCAR